MGHRRQSYCLVTQRIYGKALGARYRQVVEFEKGKLSRFSSPPCLSMREVVEITGRSRLGMRVALAHLIG